MMKESIKLYLVTYHLSVNTTLYQTYSSKCMYMLRVSVHMSCTDNMRICTHLNTMTSTTFGVGIRTTMDCVHVSNSLISMYRNADWFIGSFFVSFYFISYHYCFERGLLLTRKVLNQVLHVIKICIFYAKVYGRHHELVYGYSIYVKLITADMSHLS